MREEIGGRQHHDVELGGDGKEVNPFVVPLRDEAGDEHLQVAAAGEVQSWCIVLFVDKVDIPFFSHTFVQLVIREEFLHVLLLQELHFDELSYHIVRGKVQIQNSED